MSFNTSSSTLQEKPFASAPPEMSVSAATHVAVPSLTKCQTPLPAGVPAAVNSQIPPVCNSSSVN